MRNNLSCVIYRYFIVQKVSHQKALIIVLSVFIIHNVSLNISHGMEANQVNTENKFDYF